MDDQNQASDPQPSNINQQDDALVEEQTTSNFALDSVRQKAVEALVPLVESMEDPHDRKFELLMTAARYSSDPTLLDKALQEAMEIEDVNTKAEALVDIINESSYQEDQEA